MGRRRKKTGEKKAGEPNPFGVKKAPKKKNKKKRKKKKKVQQRISEGEMTVDDVLLLTMSQGAKRARGGGRKEVKSAREMKSQALEEAVNETVAQLENVLHL